MNIVYSNDVTWLRHFLKRVRTSECHIYTKNTEILYDDSISLQKHKLENRLSYEELIERSFDILREVNRLVDSLELVDKYLYYCQLNLEGGLGQILIRGVDDIESFREISDDIDSIRIGDDIDYWSGLCISEYLKSKRKKVLLPKRYELEYKKDIFASNNNVVFRQTKRWIKNIIEISAIKRDVHKNRDNTIQCDQLVYFVDGYDKKHYGWMKDFILSVKDMYAVDILTLSCKKNEIEFIMQDLNVNCYPIEFFASANGAFKAIYSCIEQTGKLKKAIKEHTWKYENENISEFIRMLFCKEHYIGLMDAHIKLGMFKNYFANNNPRLVGGWGCVVFPEYRILYHLRNEFSSKTKIYTIGNTIPYVSPINDSLYAYEYIEQEDICYSCYENVNRIQRLINKGMTAQVKYIYSAYSNKFFLNKHSKATKQGILWAPTGYMWHEYPYEEFIEDNKKVLAILSEMDIPSFIKYHGNMTRSDNNPMDAYNSLCFVPAGESIESALSNVNLVITAFSNVILDAVSRNILVINLSGMDKNYSAIDEGLITISRQELSREFIENVYNNYDELLARQISFFNEYFGGNYRENI